METIIEETIYLSQKKLRQKLNTKQTIDEVKQNKANKDILVSIKTSSFLGKILNPQDKTETRIYSEKEFIEALGLAEDTQIINISYNKKQLPMFDNVAIKIKYKGV